MLQDRATFPESPGTSPVAAIEQLKEQQLPRSYFGG